jgi:hypothetical protein
VLLKAAAGVTKPAAMVLPEGAVCPVLFRLQWFQTPPLTLYFTKIQAASQFNEAERHEFSQETSNLIREKFALLLTPATTFWPVMEILEIEILFAETDSNNIKLETVLAISNDFIVFYKVSFLRISSIANLSLFLILVINFLLMVFFLLLIANYKCLSKFSSRFGSRVFVGKGPR